MFPTRQQWKNWSLPSKLTAIGAYVGIVGLVFAVFIYFNPSDGLIGKPTNKKHDGPVNRIVIPIKIANSLGYQTQISPIVEYFILKTESPLTDTTIDSGTVRLERNNDLFSINGNYVIEQNRDIKTLIRLPRSKSLRRYLDEGGYKIKLVVSNVWISQYNEATDAPFDNITVSEGINISLFEAE